MKIPVFFQIHALALCLRGVFFGLPFLHQGLSNMASVFPRNVPFVAVGKSCEHLSRLDSP